MLLPPTKSGFPKAIYLDQNILSALAKSYYSGLKDAVCKSAYDAIIVTIKENKAIYPLSFVHLEEIQKIQCFERRVRLARFFIWISRGVSILNTMTIQKYEIINAVRKKIRKSEILPFDNDIRGVNIREYLLFPGLLYVLGLWDLEGVPEDLYPDVYKELVKPKTSLWLLTKPVKNDMVDLSEGAKEIEKRGKEALANRISKATWIKHEVFGFFRLDSHSHIICNELKELSIPIEVFFALFKSGHDYIAFFEDVPTYSSTCYLYIEHHKNVGGTTTINDMNDVHFLSEVIPYFNGIVMERHWAAMAKQAGLDKKYDTEVISKINDIPALLGRLGCL